MITFCLEKKMKCGLCKIYGCHHCLLLCVTMYLTGAPETYIRFCQHTRRHVAEDCFLHTRVLSIYSVCLVTLGKLGSNMLLLKNSVNTSMKISRLRLKVQSLRVVYCGYNTQPINTVFMGIECRNMIDKAGGNVKTTVF